MNKNFFTFKKLKVSGFNKQDAIIEFGTKLTILYGGSDSGKTYIYYLIRYLLGSEKLKNRDIDHAQGYDTAFLEISFQDRLMTIERSLLDNSHYRLYDSNIENASSVNLVMTFSKSVSSKKSFASFFYSKLRFKEAKVRTNLSNTLHNFNLNNVLDFFCIDELKVLTERSLIFSDIPSEDTKRKSEFKFLLTQRDDNNSLAEKPNKKARVFLKSQIANIYEGLKSELLYPEYDKASIVSELESVEHEIESLRNILKDVIDVLDEKKDLLKELSDELFLISNREKYISLLIERFNLLKDQYLIDLGRIEVVSQANYYLNNFADTYCEVCNSPQERKNKISYEDYALSCNAEKLKIKNQLQGLTDSIETNTEEHKSLLIRIKNVSDIYDVEKDEFKKLEELKYKKLNSSIEDLYEYKDNLLMDYTKHKILSSLQDKEDDVDELKYSADDFDSLTVVDFCDIEKAMENFLNDIKFNNSIGNKVRFDEGKYDFNINGKHRGMFGKGTRAVIHAIFTICFAECLSNKGNPFIGFVVLDSPLVTHFDKDRGVSPSEINSVSLSDAFYSILVKKSYNFQIIILENKGPTFSIQINDDNKVNNLNAGGKSGFYPA
ncbi:hypothetical protein [Pantoea alhagi]|nr:hypothetical protein [Pantoea alhagi]